MFQNIARFVTGALILAMVMSVDGCAADDATQAASSPQTRPAGSPGQDVLSDLGTWKNDVAVISSDLAFSSGSAEVSPEGINQLWQLSPRMTTQTSKTIRIDGYTDGVGGMGEFNQRLSEDRANVVRDWLVANANIPISRITATGHGANGTVNGRAAIEGRSDPSRRVVTITLQ
ncbi:MAG: OmpA family protein [Actinomycetales bacterium]